MFRRILFSSVLILTHAVTSVISFQRTIQRLNPLNVSIASESSIIVESIKSDTSPTGNNSISDGDFVQLQIPIINNGDYAWTGKVNLALDNGIVSETLDSETITIGGMNTSIAYFNSTIQAYEGMLNASISLNGTVDSYEDDNHRNLTLTVGPPPLPVLHTMISYDNQGLESGASLDINLNVSNNGSIGSYTGSFLNKSLYILILPNNCTSRINNVCKNH